MRRAVVAALILGAGCSANAAPGPQGGALNLSLASARGGEGALVLIVSGGPVTSVDAPGGYQIATNADGQGTHVMVVGDVTTGVVATIHVPDLMRAAAYVVTVVQVSDRNTYALLDAAPYHVTVGP